MNITKKVLAVTTALVLCEVDAAPPLQHSQYVPEDPALQIGNWDVGCNLYNILNTDFDNPHQVFLNECYVVSPANASGIEMYGFSFNASAYSHYNTQSPTPDYISQPGAWYYAGADDVSQDIRAIYLDTSTGFRLYADQLAFNYHFWYTIPNDPTQYSAGLSGSTVQQNKFSPL